MFHNVLTQMYDGFSPTFKKLAEKRYLSHVLDPDLGPCMQTVKIAVEVESMLKDVLNMLTNPGQDEAVMSWVGSKMCKSTRSFVHFLGVKRWAVSYSKPKGSASGALLVTAQGKTRFVDGMIGSFLANKVTDKCRFFPSKAKCPNRLEGCTESKKVRAVPLRELIHIPVQNEVAQKPLRGNKWLLRVKF